MAETNESGNRSVETGMGSDRSFGLVFASVFALICVLPIVSGREARWWALPPAAVILALALVQPQWLNPFNRLWFRFGNLLHRVVTPIVLGLLFFVTFTPIAILGRAFGRDALRLRLDRQADSYWIARVPPGPAPDTSKNQF
jgi:hypothetical protein